MGRLLRYLCLSLCFSASADSFQLGGQSGMPHLPCKKSRSSSSSSTVAHFPAAAAATAAASAATGTAGGPVDVALVKKLRQLTAAGYGSCVAALQRSSGDLQKAVQWLRRQGAADAAAAAAAAIAAGSDTGGSEAAQQEGIIALAQLESTSRAAGGAHAAGGPETAEAGPKGIERIVAVQMACNSDFVSRSDVFISAAKRAARAACQSQGFAAAAKSVAAGASAEDVGSERETATQQQQLLQQLLALPAQRCCPAAATSEDVGGAPDAATIGEDLGYVSRLVGEQVTLKRVALREAQRGSEIVAFYCHQPLSADVGPLAVLLHISYSRQQQHQQGEEEENEFEDRLRQLGKQLCMHIAATKPLAVVRLTIDAKPCRYLAFILWPSR